MLLQEKIMKCKS